MRYDVDINPNSPISFKIYQWQSHKIAGQANWWMDDVYLDFDRQYIEYPLVD